MISLRMIRDEMYLCFIMILCAFVNNHQKVCLVQHGAVLSCIFVFKKF